MTDNGGGLLGRVAGKIKEVAGSALGDDALAHQGRLEQEKVKAAEQAALQDDRAELQEKQADIEATKQRNAVERQRIEAETVEAETAARLERDQDRAENQVEAEFARKAAAERQREQAEADALSRQEQAAGRQRIADAAEVMARSSEADRAAAHAERIDDLRPGS